MSEILEKQLRLKYFHLIDTDSIISDIKKSPEYNRAKVYSGNCIDCLFHLIFRKIVDASKKSTGFILSNTGFVSHGFFGENTHDEEIKSTTHLAGISLFNHCIIRGFISSLKSEPVVPVKKSAFSSKDDYTLLSSKHALDISVGYLASETVSADLRKKPVGHSPANYENHYQRYYDRKAENLMSYHKLLSQSIIDDTKNSDTKSQPHLKVPKIYSNPSLFLFWDRAVLNFDRALNNDSRRGFNFNLLTRYAELEEHASAWKKEQCTDADKAIFDCMIEPIYDFRFASYIYGLYQEELRKSETPSKSIKKLLEGGLNDIVEKHALSIPLVYNKSIFLDLALKAVLNSNTLESDFPPQPLSAGSKISKANITDVSTFRSRTLELIPTYYKTLHHIVLPIVEDLWDVLTFPDMLGLKITRKDYQRFVEKYFNVISYDYTQLKNFDISNGNYAPSYQHTYNKLSEHLQNKDSAKNRCTYNELITDHKKHIAVPNLRSIANGKDICKYMAPTIKRNKLTITPTDGDSLARIILHPKTSSSNDYSVEAETIYTSHLNSLLGFISKADM